MPDSAGESDGSRIEERVLGSKAIRKPKKGQQPGFKLKANILWERDASVAVCASAERPRTSGATWWEQSPSGVLSVIESRPIPAFCVGLDVSVLGRRITSLTFHRKKLYVGVGNGTLTTVRGHALIQSLGAERSSFTAGKIKKP
jgi:hypothetical protein